MDYMNHLNDNQKQYQDNPPLEDYVFQPKEIKLSKEKKKKSLMKVLSYTLVSAIVFGVISSSIFIGMTYPIRKQLKQIPNKNESMDHHVEDAVLKDMNEDTDLKHVQNIQGMSETTIESVVQKAMPSIVAITNQSVQEVRDIFGRGLRSYESSSAGSGIIIEENDNEYLIATNFHVVDKANSLSVSFIDNEVVEGKIRGVDEARDLAIVSVKKFEIPESTLKIIKKADIDLEGQLPIGSGVVAIGNALGYGQSVTTGIISAVRNIDFSGSGVENKWIQTDAAINPGNSGGALLNMKGQIIGINTIKLSRRAVEGMGYAISMDEAMPILQELMKEDGPNYETNQSKVFLGVTGVAVSDAAMQTYDFPKGIYVVEVYEGSPADLMGLKKGDIIQGVNGKEVLNPDELKVALSKHNVGDKVSIQLQVLTDQGYEAMDKETKLMGRPSR